MYTVAKPLIEIAKTFPYCIESDPNFGYLLRQSLSTAISWNGDRQT
ncbi:MAG: hypothetical protein ACFCA4_07460 [Cyanophyceae cyanobacterium]